MNRGNGNDIRIEVKTKTRTEQSSDSCNKLRTWVFWFYSVVFEIWYNFGVTSNNPNRFATSFRVILLFGFRQFLLFFPTTSPPRLNTRWLDNPFVYLDILLGIDIFSICLERSSVPKAFLFSARLIVRVYITSHYTLQSHVFQKLFPWTNVHPRTHSGHVRGRKITEVGETLALFIWCATLRKWKICCETFELHAYRENGRFEYVLFE